VFLNLDFKIFIIDTYRPALFDTLKIKNEEYKSKSMTEVEKHKIREKLEVLKLEHQDLDDAIHHMPKTIHTQMQISRLKKRKLLLKDEIIKLENLLIPDIIA